MDILCDTAGYLNSLLALVLGAVPRLFCKIGGLPGCGQGWSKQHKLAPHFNSLSTTKSEK